jgi:Met-zincin/Domain of unknown function (DUF5117)
MELSGSPRRIKDPRLSFSPAIKGIHHVKIRNYATLAVFLALGIPACGWAQAADKDAVAADSPKATTPDSKKDDDTIDFEKFVKDLKRVDGSMPLYQKGKNIYLELPEDKIGKVFLIQAAFDSGLDTMFMHAGMPIGGQAVDAFTFQRKDDMVWLERPNITNRWSAGATFKTGAERTFPDAMLNTFRVEQHNNQKHLLLVNVTSLFTGDLFHLSEMIAGSLGGPYQLDPSRSEPLYVKGFPENTVVQMQLHYYSPHGAEPNPLMELLGLGGNTLEDDRSAPVRINFTLGWRKDSDYVARYADPRIGYFTTDFYSVDRFLEQDKDVHFINRFNLHKKDPSAALSDPVKPIVWTIDPSIPVKYRSAVKEGVLRWNKAFEAIGLKNVMQVQEVAAGDKDYDHADGRYNVIRLLVGPEAPFAAISLLRTDPFSGQILSASITLDGNVLQSLIAQHERNWPIAMQNGAQRQMQVLLRDKTRKIQDDKYLFETPKDLLQEQAEARLAKFGWTNDACNFASDIAEQANLSWNALMAAPGGSTISPDEYVHQWLAEAVSHEVGHCLGLRHNFAGSTMLTTKQLGDDKLTQEEGTSASVMDYTPPNAQAVLKGHGTIFMPTVGIYDLWAIKYGYMPTTGKSPDDDRYALSQVASQSGLPGHEYLTDEEADTDNPDAVRFDCGKDPLNFSSKQLQELTRARQYAISDLPRVGESYSLRTKIILSTILASFREGVIAARFVGGTLGNKNFKGDTAERPTLAPVPASEQRQAMDLITTSFFSPDNFNLPPAVMNSMSLDQSDVGDDVWNAPLREIISSMQGNMLALSMSANTTDNVAENAYKTGSKDAYTLDEHYDRLLHSICSEIGTNQNISPLRRDLQRLFAQGLIVQAGAPLGSLSDDVRLVTLDCLKRLKNVTAEQLAHSKGLDTMTRLHLTEMKGTMDRFLDRSMAVAR